ASLCGVEVGKQIHGQVLKIGTGWDLFVQSTLIHVCAKNGCFQFTRNMFDTMPNSDVVSWNAMLSGYVEKGLMEPGCSMIEVDGIVHEFFASEGLITKQI
ncbi:PPR domain-containing protein, partial [Cephalotus follicularis]